MEFLVFPTNRVNTPAIAGSFPGVRPRQREMQGKRWQITFQAAARRRCFLRLRGAVRCAGGLSGGSPLQLCQNLLRGLPQFGGGLLGEARQPPFAVQQRQARGFQRPVKRGAQRPVHRPLQVFCRNRRPQRRQAQKDLHPKHKVGRTAAPVLFGPAARCCAGLRRLLPVGILPHRLFPLPFSVMLCGKPPYYAPHKRQDPAAVLP